VACWWWTLTLPLLRYVSSPYLIIHISSFYGFEALQSRFHSFGRHWAPVITITHKSRRKEGKNRCISYVCRWEVYITINLLVINPEPYCFLLIAQQNFTIFLFSSRHNKENFYYNSGEVGGTLLIEQLETRYNSSLEVALFNNRPTDRVTISIPIYDYYRGLQRR